MSADGIPQLAAVMGSCTAGGAYVPAMCDESVIVRGTGTIFLGGPPLVKAATGEEVTAEELGGGDVHARISGVADQLADSDEHALALLREAVARLAARPARRRLELTEPERARSSDPERAARHRAADERTPFDVREVIARLVDGSRLRTSSSRSTARRWCAASRASGAIRSRSWRTTASSSRSRRSRAPHFIELACQRGIPLLFLQNITGFMVGKAYEHGGIAKDGAKLVMAVACAAGAEADRRDRRLVRRRQLRHVRPRLRAAAPVHVAERAHLRDGRAAGGGRC